MEVHQEAMSVAYVPPDHGAEVPYLGTRQADLDPMSPKRTSKANPLIFVYEASPCGYGLSRFLRASASNRLFGTGLGRDTGFPTSYM